MKLVRTLIVAASLGIGALGASAAAPGPQGLSLAPQAPITDVRMTRAQRRHMMRSERRMQNRNMRRPSQAGNAKNPALPPAMQNQGQTTGGPRY